MLPAQSIADFRPVGRSVIGMCSLVGATVGSFVPDLWGSSQMSLSSLLFAAIGGIAGVFFGARISQSV